MKVQDLIEKLQMLDAEQRNQEIYVYVDGQEREITLVDDSLTDRIDINIDYEPTKVINGWTMIDVNNMAEQEGIELTKDEKEEVFFKMENSFDASLGFNWDDVLSCINEVVDERD